MALVKHTFKKGDTPPPLTAEMLAEIKTLQAMSDDEIDLSDAPEELDWSGAVRGRFSTNAQDTQANYNPTVLDEDISDWLSQQDDNTKDHINGMINNLLRHVMDMRVGSVG